MALGLMNKSIEIVSLTHTTDSMGFSVDTTTTVLSTMAYVEGRHGSERWANLSTFSEATELFRFRKPSVEINTKLYIIYKSKRYDILSVEDVKGRGMYLEVLAKMSESSDGKM